MIKKQCKECPWKVKSSNNTSITEFAKKHNKQHNCHMITKNLWDVKEECMCMGSRKQMEKDGWDGVKSNRINFNKK